VKGKLSSQGTRLLIIVVIGASLLWWLTLPPKGGKKVAPLAPPPPGLSSFVAQGLPQDPTLEESRRVMERVASTSWGRDPFLLEKEGVHAIKATSDNSLANLKLYGIIWAAEGGCAIINDWVVKAGDQVAGLSVKEIHQDHLVLEGQGKRHILRMRE